MNDEVYKMAEQAKIDSLCFDDVRIPRDFIESFARALIKDCAEFTDPMTRKIMLEHYGVK